MVPESSSAKPTSRGSIRKALAEKVLPAANWNSVTALVLAAPDTSKKMVVTPLTSPPTVILSDVCDAKLTSALRTPPPTKSPATASVVIALS